MAESAATQRQMMAVGGWRNEDEVSTYAEAANQETMADAGLAHVISRFSTDEDSNNV